MEIYPKDLALKYEHLGTSATFLELDITIRDDIFGYKLYDNRDAFPFSIVCMPNLSSNIPSSIFYGAVFSGLLQVARILFADFISRASQLYRRICLQGGSKPKLNLHIRKAIRKHPSAFEKFTTTP